MARVNLANGNLLLTANDGILSGPGLSVRNDRFYNGLSSADGSLGGGWSSALSAADTGLSVTATTATYVGSNGFSVVFTKSGATWVAPAGFNAQLTEQATTFTITYNQSGEQLVFNSSGWLIQNLNRNGEGTSFTYSSGEVATVTEASGRSFSLTWSGSSIGSVSDSAGRTTTYTRDGSRQLSRVNAPGGLWSEFDYDSAGRISEARFAGINSSTVNRAVFGYDPYSKVTSIQRGVVGAGSFLTSSTYGYAGPTTTVTDGRGKTSSHSLDSSGRVVSATNALGNARSQSWTANSDVQDTTDRLGGGSRYYYATDHLGSVIGMFSATGAWLGGYSYSPYGEERAIATGTAPTTNSLRYIAGYWDATAGLYKLGARYYDPTTARFTQYDPSGQEANPYAYAACNPINALDPTGNAFNFTAGQICSFQGAIVGILATVAIGFAGFTAGASIVAGVVVGLGVYALTAFACRNVSPVFN